VFVFVLPGVYRESPGEIKAHVGQRAADRLRRADPPIDWRSFA
jgi:hypothetical protein